MFDILIERIRYCSEEYSGCGTCDLSDNCVLRAGLLQQAANAIEELSCYAQQIEELRKDGYYLQKTKMMTYGQAIMTRPLPQPPEEEK